MELKLNKYQTKLTDEVKESLPKEIWDEILEYISSVKFIQNLIAPEEKRGFIKDRPVMTYTNDNGEEVEYEDGRKLIDLTNPHILEDMDYFRERAIFFQKNGKYTNLIPNGNPKSEYAEFWRQEMDRWRHGMVRPDGEWIPGELYFYWNYAPIWMVEKDEKTKGNKKGKRVRKFPKPWLGDYLFHHYVHQAKENGSHGKMLKTRGVGASFKAGSWSPRNMYVHPGSGNPNFHLASDKGFLTGDKGIWGKVLDTLDWIAEHTPLPRMRLVDGKKALEIQLGYEDEFGSRKGLLSSVYGVSLKDNPDKARGIRGPLIHYEEDGLFPNLEKAWGVNRKAVEDGDIAFGFMIAMGTGGISGASFAGSEKLFYKPNAYNIYGIPNVFDRNTNGETECGFFWGAYLNRNLCYDVDTGEPDVIKALIEVCRDRFKVKYSSSDPLAITQKKAEEPCIVGDTFISNYSIGSNKIINFDDKFINGIKPVYEFKLKSGRSIKCTKNHKIYNGFDYKRADSYNIEDTIQLKPLIPNKEYQILKIKGNYNFDNYEIKINEEWGRFLGLYLGDGSFYNNTLRIDFDTRDVKCLEWCKYFFKKYFNKYSIKNWNDRNMISIQLHSVHIRNLFIKMDLIKKWNGNKHGYKRKILVPDYIMNSPKSVIKEYLKGYFDADSGIYKSQKNIKIYCKQLDNLKRVQYLLTAFDIYSKIKTEIKINSQGRKYIGNSMTIRSWEVDSFKEIGYISEHKQSLLDKWTSYKSKKPSNYNIDSLESFEFVDNLPVYDIETKEHCYSANGIWVHNCTPQEAIMRTEGTVFPVADLKEYLEDIMVKKEEFLSEHYVGRIIHDSNGIIKWKPDSNVYPLRSYEMASGDKTGGLEIFEMPKKGKDGKVIPNRYIAGIDPVDSDTGESLFSMLVMDLFTDRIVAEYSARPKLISTAYDVCLKTLLFYNAQANYESNLKGLFNYFEQRNKLYLLADTPQILRDMEFLKQTNLYGNKAHPYSEKVYTPNGIKQWKDIKIGDKLFGTYNNITKVVDIPFDDETEIYEITLKDGRKVKTSSNHLWDVIDWNGYKKTLSTNEIKNYYFRNKGKYKEFKYYIPKNKGVNYKYKKIKLDAYTLGILLGDGSLSRVRGNVVSFASGLEDVKTYKKIVPYEFTKPNDDRHMFIRIPNIGKIMKDLKLKGTKSRTKFIPDIYKYNSKKVRLDILKGLMDTDGTVCKLGNSSFTSTSKQLANDVLEIARSLGINGNKTVSENKFGKVYTVRLYTDIKLFNLKRKFIKQKITKTRAFKTAITNIKLINKEKAKCVTVDSKDNCYLIGDFVTTHNSKGVHVNAQINKWGRDLQAEWMLKEADSENNKLGLHTLRSLGYIEEAIKWNADGNFDRISAGNMLFILREERFKRTKQALENQENKIKTLANDDFFNKNYNSPSNKIKQEQNNSYMSNKK